MTSVTQGDLNLSGTSIANQTNTKEPAHQTVQNIHGKVKVIVIKI